MQGVSLKFLGSGNNWRLQARTWDRHVRIDDARSCKAGQDTASLRKEQEGIFSQFLERLPVTQEIAGFESRRSR
jgi:hypothetical protein